MGFTLLRVPFFLEPNYPTDTSFEETNRVRLIRKWGGRAGWNAQKRRHGLKERGRAVGIEHFNLDRVASNTLASHQLVQWVTRTIGINEAEALYNDLNFRHFEEGRKLNDEEMLVDAAVAAGADEAAAREAIRSGDGRKQIHAAQAVLQKLDVGGIPTLILGGREWLPSGAVGARHIVEALREIESQGGGTGSLFAKCLEIPDAVMEQTLAL